MDDLRTDRKSRIDWSWFEPEFLLYAIAGLIVIALGVRALTRWLTSEWLAGSRLIPILSVVGAGAIVTIVLVALRSHKRWWYLGAALTIVALVTGLLSSTGIEIPASWLK